MLPPAQPFVLSHERVFNTLQTGHQVTLNIRQRDTKTAHGFKSFPIFLQDQPIKIKTLLQLIQIKNHPRPIIDPLPGQARLRTLTHHKHQAANIKPITIIQLR